MKFTTNLKSSLYKKFDGILKLVQESFHQFNCTQHTLACFYGVYRNKTSTTTGPQQRKCWLGKGYLFALRSPLAYQAACLDAA